jgi:hypothetical protein
MTIYRYQTSFGSLWPKKGRKEERKKERKKKTVIVTIKILNKVRPHSITRVRLTL